MSTIVVIDPNYYSRMIICHHLKKAGYTVRDIPSVDMLGAFEALPVLVIADQQACDQAQADHKYLIPNSLDTIPLLILMNEEDVAFEDGRTFFHVRKPMLHSMLLDYVQKIAPLA